MTNDKSSVDALKEMDYRSQRDQEKEGRGFSTLGTSSSFNTRTATIVTVIFIVLVASCFAYSFWRKKNREQNQESEQTKVIKNHLPPLNLIPPSITPPPVSQIVDPPPMPDVVSHPLRPHSSRATKPALSPAELLRKRRLSAPLSEGRSSSSGNSAPVQAIASREGDRSDNELQNKMKPLRLNPSQAGTLGDRNYLLTQGSMIDCVLETRMITTQPGMTTCYVTRDIYSANGHVILIDRGSKIVGHYQGGLNQGQARIFILWSRVETPQGVIINLDSPGTGSLGEGGVGGEIDTHFWQRFGSAIMLSLIDDFAQGGIAAMNRNKGGQNQSITFSNTTNAAQDMASEALKNSINIPPTLYKNQGDRISVFVARDLDFRGVYDLGTE